MKFRSLMGVAALASASMAMPAFAQKLSPVGTGGPAIGPASLNGSPCVLTLQVIATGTGSTGNAGPGTNTGPTPCPLITIDPGATFALSAWNPSGGAAGLGSANGSLSNLVVKVNNNQACPTGTGLSFTVENIAGGGVRIIFPTTLLGSCSLNANLVASGFTLNP